MGFTKGEWTLELRPADNVRRVYCGTETIADVFGTNDEDKDNAQLIAAAPELYEALNRLLHASICDICYEDECGYPARDCDCNCHLVVDELHENAERAIAKVEGK